MVIMEDGNYKNGTLEGLSKLYGKMELATNYDYKNGLLVKN
jgi:hypothetical protein